MATHVVKVEVAEHIHGWLHAQCGRKLTSIESIKNNDGTEYFTLHFEDIDHLVTTEDLKAMASKPWQSETSATPAGDLAALRKRLEEKGLIDPDDDEEELPNPGPFALHEILSATAYAYRDQIAHLSGGIDKNGMIQVTIELYQPEKIGALT